MGKSPAFAVASGAPMPAAAAATRQSAWWSVTPISANDRRQLPARLPSAAPNGARRRPLNSRRACSSSPDRNPRQISSTEIAQAHGSVPVRRRPARRAAAGRPRSASMSTVVSSSKRATVNPNVVGYRVAACAPTWPDRRPTRAPSRTSCRAQPRYRPSDVRPRDHAGSVRRQRHSAAGRRHADRARLPIRRPMLYVCAWAKASTHQSTLRQRTLARPPGERR